MALDGDLATLQNAVNALESLPHGEGSQFQSIELLRQMLGTMNSTLWDLFNAITDYMVADKPFPPMFLVVQTPGDTWVQLNWTVASASATSPLTKHKVYRSDDGGLTYTNVYDVTYPHVGGDPTTGPPWVDDNGGGGLTANTDYWYKAVGTNANGDSRFCEPILFRTLP